MCWDMGSTFVSGRIVRATHIFATLLIALVVIAVPGRALAQIEPAWPGSIEYTLTSNGQSWIETSDPIIVGSYVKDLLTYRANQPEGRGIIGIVTATGFDEDYNSEAATVDFGRDYTAGIVFPELSAVRIVPEPGDEGLLAGVMIWGAGLRRRR